MSNFCPRCGYYADPAGTYCMGCGGRMDVLRANFPVLDPVVRYLSGRNAMASPTGAKARPVPAAAAAAAPARPAAPSRPAAPPPPPPPPALHLDPDDLDLSAVGAPTPPISGSRDAAFSLSGDFGADLSAAGMSGDDFTADLSGELTADLSGSGELGGVDFGGLDLGPTPAGGPNSSGELDFSALDGSPRSAPSNVPPSDVFDLDADLGGGLDASFDDGGGLDFSFQTSGPADFDAGSVPTLSFDPSAVSGSSGLGTTPATGDPFGAPGSDGAYDLDGAFGAPAAPAARGGGGGGFVAEPASGEIDFSALSADSGLGSGSGEVDFSNLSTLENSQSGDSAGEALDLSLSNFGGGLGELDFSSLVQDASGGGSGAADAIDFSGLSSIDIAPPLAASSAGVPGGGRKSDDIVYDLDLDLDGGGGGGGSGFGFDDKDMSSMEDDLLKASIISYKPHKE